MKFLTALVLVLSLNSCNTLIGLGRDGKQAIDWTKTKVQGTGGGGGGDADGAPVY
jgi:predicted small secreted protein